MSHVNETDIRKTGFGAFEVDEEPFDPNHPLYAPPRAQRPEPDFDTISTHCQVPSIRKWGHCALSFLLLALVIWFTSIALGVRLIGLRSEGATPARNITVVINQEASSVGPPSNSLHSSSTSLNPILTSSSLSDPHPASTETTTVSIPALTTFITSILAASPTTCSLTQSTIPFETPVPASAAPPETPASLSLPPPGASPMLDCYDHKQLTSLEECNKYCPGGKCKAGKKGTWTCECY